MAKKSYKIPDSLDKSFASIQIALVSKDGVGLKPMPIGYILCYVFSILAWFFIITKTFIASSGLFGIISFTLLWAAITILLMQRDKTGLPKATYIIAMLSYYPKRLRYIITRTSAKANDFYNLVGIKPPITKGGLIKFTDGTYGFAYTIIGSASVLLFESDRQRILDRLDIFYRKIKSDCELIYITPKQPQKIHKQLNAMQSRYENLDNNEIGLKQLADMNYRFLKNEVGGKFRSIHQYLILKANNKEALMVAKNTLMSECENSQLVFKQCTALFENDIIELMETIYRGKESI